MGCCMVGSSEMGGGYLVPRVGSGDGRARVLHLGELVGGSSSNLGDAQGCELTLQLLELQATTPKRSDIKSGGYASAIDNLRTRNINCDPAANQCDRSAAPT